ncbi:hypothetical protein [Floccifex sp.]|uniref:hypothetical protein n=1 Tax=Floccifex sp. TaxID=2815810 RepID=UPI002A7493FD|nr:hypothetical protein [Floccifex sp.]MDD7280941.1 hypothetical protein [Erysipelotrichaceae bacterium]MDY2958296.1 hypothetical protein [Floccifex sp.]
MKEQLLKISLLLLGIGLALYIVPMILSIQSSLPYTLAGISMIASVVILYIRSQTKE